MHSPLWLILFAAERKLGFGSLHQLRKVFVVTEDDQSRRRDREQFYPDTLRMEKTEHDRAYQRRRARSERHELAGKQDDKEHAHCHERHTPVDKPNGGESGKKALAAFKLIPDGEAVTEHGTESGELRAELPETEICFHHPGSQKNRQRCLNNIKNQHQPGDDTVAVDALIVGKARIFAAELTDILVMEQL